MRALLWLRARWLNIVPEPRYESVIYTVVYGLFVLTGLVTLVWPPNTIANVLGYAGINLVGWLMVIGGVVGMWAGQREWWEAERVAIATMFTGLSVYGIIVAALHFQGTGSRLTQLGLICIAAMTLVLRFGAIHKYAFKPRGVPHGGH